MSKIKSTKFWITMLVIAIIGLIMIAVGSIMGGGITNVTSSFTTSNISADTSVIDLTTADSNTVNAANITGLEINLSDSSLSIKTGESFTVSSVGLCDKYIKNGVLYVGYSDSTKYSADLMGGKFTLSSKTVTGHGSVVVTIPANYQFQNIKINTKRCNITADDFQTGNLEMNVKYGKTNISNLLVDTAKIESNYGKVSIGTIQASQSCEIRTGFGDINVGQEGTTDNVVNALVTKSSYGDINVYSKLTGTSAVKTSHGKVAVCLNGSKANYTISGNHDIQYKESGTVGSDSNVYGSIYLTAGKGKLSVSFI